MQAGIVRADWGRLSAHSRALRLGCHNYAYRYSVNPPPGDWALETFLGHRATGRRVASDGALGGVDPKAGRRHFRLCRPSTKRGGTSSSDC